MSASTWGFPNATKRVFLIHGLSSSSHVWKTIALEFVSRGYFVTAPDLLGHGSARRGSDYTVAALARELEPYFTTTQDSDVPYDIVIGHSLGGTVAAALLPILKSSKPVQLVLVDPPFELTSEQLASSQSFVLDRLTNIKSPEELQELWPTMSKERAVLSNLASRLCDKAAVEAVYEQNLPWSFLHLLSAVPDNVKLTVLAADPSKNAAMKEIQLEAYPHVTGKTVWGASHLIHIEAPEVIIETALQGVN